MRQIILLAMGAFAASGIGSIGPAAAETKAAWLGQWSRCAPQSPRFTVQLVLAANRITQIYHSKGKEMARSIVEVRYKVAGERITALILKTFKKDGSVRKSYEDVVGKIFYEFRWKNAEPGVLTYVASKTPTKPRRALPQPYVYKRTCPTSG